MTETPPEYCPPRAQRYLTVVFEVQADTSVGALLDSLPTWVAVSHSHEIAENDQRRREIVERKPLTDKFISRISREEMVIGLVKRDGATGSRIARRVEAAHGIGAAISNALEFDEPASMSEEPVAWRTEGVHPGAHRFTDIGLQAEAWEKQGKVVEPLYTNAAAPELLEALHYIEGLALAEESRDLPTIAQAARAAISKATAPWA